MSCPIKDENGELDEDALHDLVEIGGHIVEGGIKKYSDWKVAMQTKVGDIFNEGDLRTIFENIQADAERKTGERQTLSVDDAFFKAMRARLGNTRASADWVNALVGPNGDTTILNKILSEKPLTAAEARIVSDATKALKVNRKPGAKATEGPMGIVQKALDDAEAEKQARKAVAKQAKPKEPKEEGLRELRSEQYRVNPEETPEQAYERMIRAEQASAPPGSPPREPMPKAPKEDVPSVDDHLEAYQVGRERPGPAELGVYDMGKEPLTDDVLFDRQMSKVLGGPDKAEQFRNSVPQAIYDKMITDGIKSLSGAEAKTVSDAMAKVMEPPKEVKPTKFSTDIKDIAKEARAQLTRHEAERRIETHEAAKDWVRDQLQAQVPERRMAEVDKALSAVPDGDKRALAEVFNRFADRGSLRGTTARLALQSGMLSNPASLATALYSHLLSAGIDQTLSKAIAQGLSGRLHASVDMNALGRAIRKGTMEGLPEAAEILAHGPNAMVLDNRDSLHIPGEDLHQEFTVGNGGKVAGVANAVGRFGGRMHAAAWHAVGVGLQEIALQDAAHYAAIDEMEAKGEHWTPEQIKVRTAELHDDPTQKVLDEADKQRREQMFQNPNAMAEMLKGNNIRNANVRAAVKGFTAPVVPFATVASNITGRAIEHTPVGAFASVLNEIGKHASANKMHVDLLSSHAVSDVKAILKSMPAADRAHLAKIAARGIVGTGVSALGYAGYKHRVVNAPAPKRGEYGSINGPFGKKWEVGRVLGPYAAPLFLGADLARAQETHDPKVEFSPDYWTNNLVTAVNENPMANVGNIYQEATANEPSKAGKPSGFTRAAAAYLTAGVPSFLSNLAGVTDNGTSSPSFLEANGNFALDPAHMSRDKNTDDFAQYIVNTFKAKIPFWRQTLKRGKYEDASTLWPEPRHVSEPSERKIISDRMSDTKFAKKDVHPVPRRRH